jgi:hypothetical protein
VPVVLVHAIARQSARFSLLRPALASLAYVVCTRVADRRAAST